MLKRPDHCSHEELTPTANGTRKGHCRTLKERTLYIRVRAFLHLSFIKFSMSVHTNIAKRYPDFGRRHGLCPSRTTHRYRHLFITGRPAVCRLVNAHHTTIRTLRNNNPDARFRWTHNYSPSHVQSQSAGPRRLVEEIGLRLHATRVVSPPPPPVHRSRELQKP